MRVLHVFDHSIPLQSGYSFRSISILEQQRARGWETVHLTSPKHVLPFRPEEDIEGWHFYRTAAPGPLSQKVPGAAQWAQMAATTRRLREVADAVKPDLLHAHSPVLNAIPALRVGRALDIPVVYEVRGLWEDAAVSHGTGRHGSLRYHLSRALETYAIKRADAITVICEGLREDLLARGIPSDKITVIPNAVDPTLFRLPPWDAALAVKLRLSGKDVLGFLGSFYSYEGLHLLLEALPSILSARPDTRLLLVGGGPEDRRLKDLSVRLGLNDAVVFTGRVPHDQIQRYYALVDVLIYPRIALRLTEKVTPLKPLEAMALGKVVIASDVGGHRELIRDGVTGNLFRANDRDDLVHAVLRLLDNRSDWPRQVKAGHHFVEHERTWRLSVARYEPVYQRLVDRRTSSNKAI